MALVSMEQQYWEEEEEAVEVGLKRRHESRPQEVEEAAATTTVNGKDDTTAFTNGIEPTDVKLITAITITIPETEILTELPIQPPPLETSSPEPDIQLIQVNPSHINGTASNGSITTMQESRHHYTDVYLEPTFQKQPTQEFFCPNCNTCIRKVVLRDSDWQFVPSPPVAPEPIDIPRQREPFRCPSCFSFLIPVVTAICNLIRDKGEPPLPRETPSGKLDDPIKKGSDTTEDQFPSQPSEKLDENENGSETSKDPSRSERIDGGLGSKAGEQIGEARPRQEPPPFEVVIDGTTSGKKKKSGKLSPIPKIPSEAKNEEEPKKSGKGAVAGKLPISTPAVAGSSARAVEEPSAASGEGDKLEILKSIVYGGLAESISSLSVVTSAAGANVSSLKIIAMALANLIGGLFVIIHNIWDLKAEQARTVLNENEEVDRYQKLLGKRKNFALHATFVLLSFLVFGVEPPLVYSFSFRESDNRDYKLAVVAGASFLCISLLALGKAHIQKPSSYHGYLKTLVYYLVIGFAASGISYVAGDLIRKLLDKLGLFKSESEAAFFLPFNDVSAVNPTWSSY